MHLQKIIGKGVQTERSSQKFVQVFLTNSSIYAFGFFSPLHFHEEHKEVWLWPQDLGLWRRQPARMLMILPHQRSV